MGAFVSENSGANKPEINFVFGTIDIAWSYTQKYATRIVCISHKLSIYFHFRSRIVFFNQFSVPINFQVIFCNFYFSEVLHFEIFS